MSLMKTAANAFLRGVTSRQVKAIAKSRQPKRATAPIAKPPRVLRFARPRPQRGRRSAPNLSGNSIARSTIAPVAVSNTVTNRSPRPVTINHRELIGTISSTSTDFTIVSRSAVQPGLAASFPWLYAIAHSFDQYSINSLSYEFITRCNTATPGAVIMAFDYDATDPVFTSYAQMANHDSSISCTPWKDARCSIDRKATQDYKRHYIRGVTPNNTTDLKTTDVATFTLALNGVPAGAVGDLYVTYSINFYKPQQPSGLDATVGQFGHVDYYLNAAYNPSLGGALYNQSITYSQTGNFDEGPNDEWRAPGPSPTNALARLATGYSYEVLFRVQSTGTPPAPAISAPPAVTVTPGVSFGLHYPSASTQSVFNLNSGFYWTFTYSFTLTSPSYQLVDLVPGGPWSPTADDNIFVSIYCKPLPPASKDSKIQVPTLTHSVPVLAQDEKSIPTTHHANTAQPIVSRNGVAKLQLVDDYVVVPRATSHPPIR